MLILAGVTISLALGDNGIIGKAQEASNMYANATKDETAMMTETDDQIEELSTGAQLSDRKVLKVTEKTSKPGTEGLMEVNYKPAETNNTVIIPGVYSGANADQELSQSYFRVQNLKWYVLNADENGVNLVSQALKNVIFGNAGGYDNCLYYYKEIATHLFKNETKGVTEDRVHVFNLTDIKKTAEKINKITDAKVIENETEREWDWELDVVKESSEEAYNSGIKRDITYTPRNKRYPQIYGTSTGEVDVNNPMYDEEVPPNFTPIEGDLINGDTPTSSTASVLKVYHTAFNTIDNETTKIRMNNFSDSGIFDVIFDPKTSILLASRCVTGGAGRAGFTLRGVEKGCIFNRYVFAYSDGVKNSPIYSFRIVVSIPGSMVNIADDGTVTLK